MAFFAASQKDVDAVKWWAAGRLNELSPVHSSMAEVDALLRIASDDDMALAVMELAGESDEAMSFIQQLVAKRAALVAGGDGAGLSQSRDGLVAYQKAEVAEPSGGGKRKKKKQPQQDGANVPHQQQQVNVKPSAKNNKGAAAAREECYCMGRDHPLVGNCLSCGKIICELEGRGQPCLFCGADLTASSTGRSDAHLEEAVARKNALLEYEKKSVARSLVYDDQADYFNSDSQWMSKEEKTRVREKERQAREHKEKQKHAVRIAVDIFGRRMVVLENEDANRSIYQPFDLSEPPAAPAAAAAGAPGPHVDATMAASAVVRPTYLPSCAPEEPAQKQQPSKRAARRPKADSAKVQHEYFEVEDEETVGAGGAAAAAPPYFPVSGLVLDAPSEVWLRTDVTCVVDAVPPGAKRERIVLRVRPPLRLEELAALFRADAVLAVLVDLSAADTVPEVKSADGKGAPMTLARHHADLIAAVVAQRTDTCKARVWALGRHAQLQPDGNYAASRKYWNELNDSVRRHVSFVVTANTQDNAVVSKQDMAALRALLGDKRPVILFDAVTSCPFAPYEGRQFGLDLQGLFCVVSDPPAVACVGVRTALAYQARPASYDPVDAFKRVVSEACQLSSDAREVRQLLDVIRFVPGVARLQGELDAMRAKLQSRRQLDELRDALKALRASPAIRSWLGVEGLEALEARVLRPVEGLVDKFAASVVAVKRSVGKSAPKQPQQQQQPQKSRKGRGKGQAAAAAAAVSSNKDDDEDLVWGPQ